MHCTFTRIAHQKWTFPVRDQAQTLFGKKKKTMQQYYHVASIAKKKEEIIKTKPLIHTAYRKP